MTIIRTNEDRRADLDPIDYIEQFIKDIKFFKKEATANGKAALAECFENVLDFIAYARADYDRMNWLIDNSHLVQIRTTDLRNFIDFELEKK